MSGLVKKLKKSSYQFRKAGSKDELYVSEKQQVECLVPALDRLLSGIDQFTQGARDMVIENQNFCAAISILAMNNRACLESEQFLKNELEEEAKRSKATFDRTHFHSKCLLRVWQSKFETILTRTLEGSATMKLAVYRAQLQRALAQAPDREQRRMTRDYYQDKVEKLYRQQNHLEEALERTAAAAASATTESPSKSKQAVLAARQSLKEHTIVLERNREKLENAEHDFSVVNEAMKVQLGILFVDRLDVFSNVLTDFIHSQKLFFQALTASLELLFRDKIKVEEDTPQQASIGMMSGGGQWIQAKSAQLNMLILSRGHDGWLQSAGLPSLTLMKLNPVTTPAHPHHHRTESALSSTETALESTGDQQRIHTSSTPSTVAKRGSEGMLDAFKRKILGQGQDQGRTVNLSLKELKAHHQTDRTAVETAYTSLRRLSTLNEDLLSASRGVTANIASELRPAMLKAEGIRALGFGLLSDCDDLHDSWGMAIQESKDTFAATLELLSGLRDAHGILSRNLALQEECRSKVDYRRVVVDKFISHRFLEEKNTVVAINSVSPDTLASSRHTAAAEAKKSSSSCPPGPGSSASASRHAEALTASPLLHPEAKEWKIRSEKDLKNLEKLESQFAAVQAEYVKVTQQCSTDLKRLAISQARIFSLVVGSVCSCQVKVWGQVGHLMSRVWMPDPRFTNLLARTAAPSTGGRTHDGVVLERDLSYGSWLQGEIEETTTTTTTTTVVAESTSSPYRSPGKTHFTTRLSQHLSPALMHQLEVKDGAENPVLPPPSACRVIGGGASSCLASPPFPLAETVPPSCAASASSSSSAPSHAAVCAPATSAAPSSSPLRTDPAPPAADHKENNTKGASAGIVDTTTTTTTASFSPPVSSAVPAQSNPVRTGLSSSCTPLKVFSSRLSRAGRTSTPPMSSRWRRHRSSLFTKSSSFRNLPSRRINGAVVKGKSPLQVETSDLALVVQTEESDFAGSEGVVKSLSQVQEAYFGVSASFSNSSREDYLQKNIHLPETELGTLMESPRGNPTLFGFSKRGSMMKDNVPKVNKLSAAH